MQVKEAPCWTPSGSSEGSSRRNCRILLVRMDRGRVDAKDVRQGGSDRAARSGRCRLQDEAAREESALMEGGRVCD